MKADIVIVGSGVSALTAAAILGKKGRKVIVVERQANPGGALRQFKRRGISFDVGFHYTGCLKEGEVLDLLWEYCGIRSQIDVLSLQDSGFDRYDFNDLKRPVRAYFDYDRLAEELKTCFPEEQQGIDTYLSTIRAICAEVPFYRYDRPLMEFLRGHKQRPRSLHDFFQCHVKDPRLKAILAGPGFLYGVPTSLASLEVHALVAHGYYSGAFAVDGGGQVIVDAFINALEAMGVALYTGREVTAIEVRGGQITAVILEDGKEIECGTVIYTGHPSALLGRLPESVFRPAYRHRLAGLRNSLSMFAVFGMADRPVPFRPDPLNYYSMPSGHNVLPEYGEVPDSQRPMMMTAARSRSQQSLQQDQNGIILLGLGYWQDVAQFSDSSPENRPAGYLQLKERISSQMIARTREKWGDICGDIEPLAVGTPLTFRDELGAPEGCAYGAMHCLDQYNPEVRTRLPGLYLAGQSTLMTGVVGASLSGMVVAGEIVGLEALWEEVKACR